MSVCMSICLSVHMSDHPISPSVYTLLTSTHHCIFTIPSTCSSHYYFGSLIFDFGMVTLTLTLLVTSIPKWYICCVLPISQMSLKGSDLGGHLKYIFIDELLMLGTSMATFIHKHQQKISGSAKDFGGYSIIFVGDLFQLKPVGDSYIFQNG